MPAARGAPFPASFRRGGGARQQRATDHVNQQGFLITDTFSFGTSQVPDVVFGCSIDIMEKDLAGASGFAGFSRGALSLVSQLDISSFTYFIAPLDEPAGESFVSWSWGADDGLDNAGAQMSTAGGSTPLQAAKENQNPDLYYVKLTGVMVDGQLLTSIPAGTFDVQADGSGGVFLSTTLHVTYLEVAGYRALRRELVSRFRSEGMAPVNVAGDLGHLCFLTEDFTSAKVPRIALVFDGDAAMELNVENYFLAVTGGQTCLTILPSRFGSVLGVLLQTGRNMTYDIHGGQLKFQATTAMVSAGAPAPKPVSLMITATLLVLLLFGPRSPF
ncbi:aspartic proteinase nepenthesin-1 [Lolium perenne]|uniref:aspartic proteinase nepenthesin-1 n=1 Tax=Lolium perenne TaxID=4522 RepID=UPI003A995B18